MNTRIRIKRYITNGIHHITKLCALSATAGLNFLFHFFFIIGFTLRAHHNNTQIIININAGNDIIIIQHVLIF